ncbi:plasmid transfer protein TraA [Streptomyces phytophilus]|uniref:plasmid transfer protein TraA n=1 Tax=Streptomyces phytophilus TaxID=722715 RepID=UPI0015F08FAA|nr:plasmid transfer protein TraA [Streptomyces phytophilus]
MANGTGPTRPQRPPSAAQQVDNFRQAQAAQPFARPPKPSVPKAKYGGGFNTSFNPMINITKIEGGAPTAPAAGRNGAAALQEDDLGSNEGIRAFCERGRKEARQRSTTRGMDAEELETRLRHIPDEFGSMAGSRARARRVTRWLKRIAQAEKLIAKWYTATYAAFEREYEGPLSRIGRGRAQQQPHPRFAFKR